MPRAMGSGLPATQRWPGGPAADPDILLVSAGMRLGCRRIFGNEDIESRTN